MREHIFLVQGPGEPILRQITQEEWEELFQVRYLAQQRFQDTKTFRRAVRYCPLFFKGSLGMEQRWLAKWYAQERREGKVAPVSTRWIDSEIGYGLFAEESFPLGTYIGYYTGVVRQWSLWKQNQNGYCFRYPSWFWPIFMIDALKEGNEMRFVNHSDTPNLEVLSQLEDGVFYLFFRTRTAVLKGEQLTLDYGKDYWRRRTKR